MGFLKKVLDGNKRELNSLSKIADKVMQYEEEVSKYRDENFIEKTNKYIDDLSEMGSIDQQDKYLDKILPEAFALVREAAKRTLGLSPYKVQVMGGIAIHRGDIAEMKTGEGKTLTATMPVYLNALTKRGVHVVTVNEYLSSVQSEEMSKLYEFLGLTVGLNLNAKETVDKRHAYNQDITYSTNNELGFDYLRDNMVAYKKDRVMRELNFAIIDEVDSILIDEARTPLIISGQAEKSNTLYVQSNAFVRMLKSDDDYTYDEQTKGIQLTEQGIEKAEKMFKVDNLFDVAHVNLVHHINNALKAHHTMLRDKDYVIQDGEVVIVDQFTGRTMSGRRFSEGLHQAIEAKEGVEIKNESKTMASITFQNFFRMYNKLSGMTGTAKTEEEEFMDIYNMKVTQIPTNKPIARADKPDLIYATPEGKYKAIVEEVIAKHKAGQPVLIGTVAVETSEYLSKLLKKNGVRHNVLNAKNHEKEAEIIQNAGERGSVTIATNMAGRGTDIKLGEGVTDVGGLAVIGTERHESRRIDDQLRGRSGRQGDIGDSRFYLSLRDELMVRFGSERLHGMMERFGMNDDTPLESKMISRAVESAQKRVEGNNFDARKRLLEYDDVQAKQRKIMYEERNEILESDDNSDRVISYIKGALERAINFHFVGDEDQYNYEAFINYANDHYLTDQEVTEKELIGKEHDEIFDVMYEKVMAEYRHKEELLGEERMRQFEKMIILQVMDNKWTSHIDTMDQLRTGIHLRSYGQINPLRDYQNEGRELFDAVIDSIEEDVTKYILKAEVNEEAELKRKQVAKGEAMQANDGKQKVKAQPKQVKKVGRNEPCPCGSGKKHKNCCLGK